MRNFIFLMLLLTVSCKKDEVKLLIFEAGPQDTGHCEATRDEQMWSATAWAHIGPYNTKKYVDFLFTTYSTGALREYMLIDGMLAKEGVYPVRGYPADTANVFAGATLTIWGSDGDVEEAYYHSDSTNAQSTITITKLDTSAGILEGEFSELNFLFEGGDATYPKSLKYSAGKFSINLK